MAKSVDDVASERAEQVRALGGEVTEHVMANIDELVDACNGLADFPRRFRKTPRYGADAHVRVHGNYVIVYDVIGDEVRINAVVHRARDMDALLG